MNALDDPARTAKLESAQPWRIQSKNYRFPLAVFEGIARGAWRKLVNFILSEAFPEDNVLDVVWMLVCDQAHTPIYLGGRP